ncbi:MAG: zf-HC2 domain-containing protein [Anaerolineaceae bacterium]|jgi:anti-sigma factor RsiW
MSEHTGCHDYCAMISEFIDGELPADLCAALEKHLTGCDNCTIVLNTMKKTIELYHEDEGSADLPEGVKRRLFTTLSLADYLRK